MRSESEIRHAEERIRAGRRLRPRAALGHVTVFEIEFDQILLERGTGRERGRHGVPFGA